MVTILMDIMVGNNLLFVIMYFLSLLLACQDSVRAPSGALFHDSSIAEEESPKNDFDYSERALSSNIDERVVLSLVNDHRLQEGLDPLRIQGVLLQIARKHSKDMALGALPLGHDGFEERTEEILEYFDPSYYDIAENVGLAYGDDAPQESVQMWLESNGHRNNIEGPYNMTGVGSYEIDGVTYFTQIFLGID